MKNKRPLELVYTAAEAVSELEVSRRHILRLCSAGRLVFRDASGTLLVLNDSVDEYNESRVKIEGESE
ncbi:hypothetical protein AB4Z29_31755 [Paenibacillus sp. 2TAB23]|uniref:hypothetical protein n=1 Tax=Paenibacillus sp. 2TAB23 TaxID=3233004 RepID=UPI003F9635C8